MRDAVIAVVVGLTAWYFCLWLCWLLLVVTSALCSFGCGCWVCDLVVDYCDYDWWVFL